MQYGSYTILNSCGVGKSTSCQIPGEVLSVSSTFSPNWHQGVETRGTSPKGLIACACSFWIIPNHICIPLLSASWCIWNTFSLGVSPLRFSFLLSVRDFAHHWPSSALSLPLCGLTLFSHFLISQEAFLSKNSGRRGFAWQLTMLSFGKMMK